jgi:flagellar biosynthesis protein FliR
VEDLTNQAVAILLVSLRIAPTIAFAPPFTLVRIPALVRVILAIALSAWLVSTFPAQTSGVDYWSRGLPLVAASELIMGIALALALQLAFAALLTAGRAVDIQAGFGFALLVDPATRGQSPLVGMIFAYAAAMIFFMTGAPADLLAIWAASVAQAPIGSGVGADALPVLAAYLTSVFVIAFGAAGLILLVLLLLDLAIAFMSRTMPQMNMLILGFQVKTLAVLIVLPIAIALAGSLFARLVRFALDNTASLAGIA